MSAPRDFLFMGEQPEHFDRERIYDATDPRDVAKKKFRNRAITIRDEAAQWLLDAEHLGSERSGQSVEEIARMRRMVASLTAFIAEVSK